MYVGVIPGVLGIPPGDAMLSGQSSWKTPVTLIRQDHQGPVFPGHEGLGPLAGIECQPAEVPVGGKGNES